MLSPVAVILIDFKENNTFYVIKYNLQLKERTLRIKDDLAILLTVFNKTMSHF